MYVCVIIIYICPILLLNGARCSFMVRAYAHGAMGRLIDPSWWTH